MQFITEADQGLTSKQYEALGKAFQAAFLIDGNPQVEIIEVSPQDIAVINKEHRGVSAPTDVLSFPIFSTLTEIQKFSSQTDEMLIGTLIICKEVAEADQTPYIELVAHGLLHLIGFDHDTNQAEWDTQETLFISKAAEHTLALQGLQFALQPTVSHDTL